MMQMVRVIAAVLFFACFSFIEAKASHCAGGEITYTWISDSTYQFKFTFYRDCSGLAEPSTVTLCYYATCGGPVYQTILNKAPSPNGGEVSTGCPGFSSNCSSGSNYGYREWVYVNNVTLPSQCNFWKFYVTISARNGGQINLQGGGNQNFYVETTFDNQAAQGNSSPYFTVKPVPYMCVNGSFTFNNGAVDPNGDSLSFEMVSPLTSASLTCTTNPNPTPILATTGTPPFNVTTNPLQTNNTFTINSQTGQLSFTPSVVQRATITVLVREWRNGVQIGSIMRDVQVIVMNCTSTPPSLAQDTSGSGVHFNGNQVEGCANEPMFFCFDIASSDTDAVLVLYDNSAISTPGATITYTGMYSDSARGCLSWIPSMSDTGLHVLTITVKDSNCKPPGIILQQTYTIPIYIWPPTRTREDTVICQADPIQLWATGGVDYEWEVLPGGDAITSLSCTNCQFPIATPSLTTSYVVTSVGGGNDFCNKNKDTVTIHVLPPPAFDYGPDTTICIGQSIQLNPTFTPDPSLTYSVKWTPGTYLNNDTLLSPVATPQNDISYVVKVTPNGSGECAGFDTINITVLKYYEVYTRDTAICEGASIQVTAVGDPRYTYSWTPTWGVSDPASLTPIINNLDTSGTYTVTASFPGCPDSSYSIFVDVQPVPQVYLGPDVTLCYGDTMHLFASVSPSWYPHYSYSWTPTGPLSESDVPNPVFTATNNTTLSATVTTPAGCVGTDDKFIEVIAPKFLTTFGDASICPRDTVTIGAAGATIASVEWTPALFIEDSTLLTPRVWPVTGTRFFVVARDTNNCLDSGSVYVDVHPDAVVFLPDSVRIFPGETYQMNPGGNGMYFSWFPPLGLSDTKISNPIASPNVNTRYFVHVATESGCEAVDSIDVYVSHVSYIDVPNAFTPGSMPNAVLHVVRKGEAQLISFRIYNRWGVKLFETKDINEGWDGTYGGQPQPMGVYVYVLEAVTSNGRKVNKQGNVTLLR